MKTVFVDANVFLRFFTVDDEGQHARAVGLFRKASSGGVRLITGPPVFFEVAWTLRSAYRQSRAAIVNVLSAMAAMPGLSLTDADAVEDAISLARRTGQEFADAYIVASAALTGAEAIATFNQRDFEKLGARPFHFS